jgi:hypothetical protein
MVVSTIMNIDEARAIVIPSTSAADRYIISPRIIMDLQVSEVVTAFPPKKIDR